MEKYCGQAVFSKDFVNRQSRSGELSFKSVTQSFHKPKNEPKEDAKEFFYEKLQMVDNIDVLRFVNENCEFLSAFTPMQPRYVKQLADDDVLLAVIVSQAMNHGRLKLVNIPVRWSRHSGNG
jgi:hypothetical protein